MGRQARCTVQMSKKRFEAEALLETNEVIVRGTDRRWKVRFDELRRCEAVDGALTLQTEQETVVLELGAHAEAWAEKIRHPPSRLDKLGVKAGLTIDVVGEIDPGFWEELRARVPDATRSGRARGLDLIFLPVATAADLDRLSVLRDRLGPTGAIWILRPKGKSPAGSVTEAEVRAASRAAGLVDTKVAAFSGTHTAERYGVPRSARPSTQPPKAKKR